MSGRVIYIGSGIETFDCVLDYVDVAQMSPLCIKVVRRNTT
jgi:hypothetical protein